MDLETAIKIEAAASDSHFRLLPCPACRSDNVAYVQYMTGIQEPWKVSCFDCGYTVDRQKIWRHEAQVAWNKNARGEDYDRNNRQLAAEALQRVPIQKACLF
jgi:hypothetical protein